jgi:hypothetical protein
MRQLEAAGVDQVMLMHQGGRMSHEHNCESLELFAREIMPEFRDREDKRQAEKAARLEPIIRQRAGAILDELPVGEDFDWVEKVSVELTTMTLATLFERS